MPNNSPSPVASQKIFSSHEIAAAGITGGLGTLVVGTAFDSRDFQFLAFIATLISTASVNKTGIVLFEIICADDSGMSVNVTQVKTTGAIASAKAGDLVGLECLSEEIAQISRSNGYNSRYVAARVTLSSTSDVAAMTAIFAGAEAPTLNLTNALNITAASTTT